jgi:hypothetical protein
MSLSCRQLVKIAVRAHWELIIEHTSLAEKMMQARQARDDVLDDPTAHSF